MVEPEPKEVEREARKLIKELGYYVHEYSWAYGVVHSRQVMDSVHVSSSIARPSDPDSLMKEAEAFLGRHRGLASSMREARKKVARATDTLKEGLAKDERRHGLDVGIAELSTESESDKVDRKDAQIRRRARGESIP